MNPPESVPLHGGNMYYPNTGQPSSMVQYTTVNIHQEMPKDHFLWSLFCVLYSNPCCLGLSALIHSVKARDRKVMGDIEGARRHGSKARNLNITATVLTVLMIILTIILIVKLSTLFAGIVHSVSNSFEQNNRGHK